MTRHIPLLLLASCLVGPFALAAETGPVLPAPCRAVGDTAVCDRTRFDVLVRKCADDAAALKTCRIDLRVAADDLTDANTALAALRTPALTPAIGPVKPAIDWGAWPVVFAGVGGALTTGGALCPVPPGVRVGMVVVGLSLISAGIALVLR